PILPDPDSSTISTTGILVVRRTFWAPRERVFRAWIEPEALESWFRPRGMSMTVSALEAREGGVFCFELASGVSVVGTYLHFVPPEKLVFTWSGGSTADARSIITVNFIDRGTATEIVLTHEGFATPEARALVESGWPSLFDMLAAKLVSTFPDE